MTKIHKKNVLNYTFSEIQQQVFEQKIKPFVAGQIMDWVYKKYCTDFYAMSNLSLSNRDLLSATFEMNSCSSYRVIPSSDGKAIKFVMTLYDGNFLECVVLKEKEYHTLCVSSQCGCPMDCKFCLTGVMGFKRQLEVYEIVGQVLLAFKEGYPISHIVFMGMGEPLLNFERVFKAISILTDKRGFNISKRKITVSTAGYLQGIERLIKEKIYINLAFSVGNANPVKRIALMPIEKRNPILEVARRLKYYQTLHNRKLTLEYTLLEGKNDGKNDISELIHLAKYLNAKVNLINLNPHPRILFTPLSSKRLKTIKETIKTSGVPVTIRFRKGQDITAACGQLGESFSIVES